VFPPPLLYHRTTHGGLETCHNLLVTVGSGLRSAIDSGLDRKAVRNELVVPILYGSQS
jgi:hypothetical protein